MGRWSVGIEGVVRPDYLTTLSAADVADVLGQVLGGTLETIVVPRHITQKKPRKGWKGRPLGSKNKPKDLTAPPKAPHIPHRLMTRDERDYMVWMRKQGKTFKEIAEAVGIGTSTARRYVNAEGVS